jgi:NADH:ubiquinone oxidoreductase subunit 2 (subunit N)
MIVKEEANKILSLTNHDMLKALELLEKQLNTLHARAQVLMSLAGIVVTVTGFSGRLIAATSLISQVLVISGLVTVLSSAVWVFSRVMGIKWVTTGLTENDTESLEKIIERRNRKTRAYSRGGVILCVGLLLYSIAFAIMLLHP